MSKKETTNDCRDLLNQNEDTNFSKPFISFIGILFVVIVGNGFRNFRLHFPIEDFINDTQLEHLVFLAYFLAGYFIVITDFVTYYNLINKYPYRNRKIGRFFLDIFIFFLLYLLIDVVSDWPTPRNFCIFTFILAGWHCSVAIWHVWKNLQYSYKWHLDVLKHIIRIIFCIGFIAFYNKGSLKIPGMQLPENNKNLILENMWWILALIALVSFSNILRLKDFYKDKSGEL